MSAIKTIDQFATDAAQYNEAASDLHEATAAVKSANNHLEYCNSKYQEVQSLRYGTLWFKASELKVGLFSDMIPLEKSFSVSMILCSLEGFCIYYEQNGEMQYSSIRYNRLIRKNDQGLLFERPCSTPAELYLLLQGDDALLNKLKSILEGQTTRLAGFFLIQKMPL